MAATPQATRPGERRPFPDLVRGAALLGIGLVNVHLMSAPYLSMHGETRLWTDPASEVTRFLVSFFFESTSFVVFSILFGAGFGRLMEKRAEAGGAGLGFYWRRLAVLAGLGLLHVGFLWYGDVLLLYAMCGAALLLFHQCRERTLWIWVGVAALMPLVAMLGFHALFALATLTYGEFDSAGWQEAQLLGMIERRDGLVATYSTGSWGEVVWARLGEYGDAAWSLPFFLPEILAGMLVGLILSRRGVLAEPERHGEFFRRVVWVALPVAVLGKGFYALKVNEAGLVPGPLIYGVLASGFMGGLALALVYLAALRALWLSGRARRLLEHVRAAGRMALTHYLGQSLIATTVLYSYGLGWYGGITCWQAVLLMGAIYAMQLAVSPAWFRRFPLGPVEWVARRISYGRPRAAPRPAPLPPSSGIQP